MQSHVINNLFPVLIPQIAGYVNAKSLDAFKWLGNEHLAQWSLFCDEQSCDACHPNDAGYDYLAAKIYG